MRATTTGQAATAYTTMRPAYANQVELAVRRAQADNVSRVRFYNWLQIQEPEVFSLLRAARPELVNPGYAVSGLGEGTTSSDLKETAQGVLDFLTQSVPAYFQFRGQEQLIKLNLERMARGEPPINADAITPGVNVGVSADTRKLLYIAVGGLALVALAFVFKKR